MLNIFNLQTDPAALEEDMIDGAYSSSQPLIACGYIGDKAIWTQTSINTVELIRVEDTTMFLNISKVSSSKHQTLVVPSPSRLHNLLRSEEQLVLPLRG